MWNKHLLQHMHPLKRDREKNQRKFDEKTLQNALNTFDINCMVAYVNNMQRIQFNQQSNHTKKIK